MRIRPFSIGLSSPLRTAHGEITERDGFLVEVAARDDPRAPATGVGEATPLPGWTESLAACEGVLAGDDGGSPDPDEIDPHETPAARHGVALAVGDATAREAGRPLAARLADHAGFSESTECSASAEFSESARSHDAAGSTPSEAAPSPTVPVNATVGDGSRAETVAAAERAVDDGYDCIKLKVGARSVEADLSRLRGVREAVGPAVELRADANGAWDPKTARRALDGFEEVDLAYVEQPLSAESVTETARLRAATAVPIALDESLGTHSVTAVLAAEAADVVVLKPMVLGGPDRTVAAAKLARDAGVEPVVTTTIDAAVARTAAVHVAGAIPDVGACGLATADLLAADLTPDPCPVSDGRIAVPDGPGLADDAFEDLFR